MLGIIWALSSNYKAKWALEIYGVLRKATNFGILKGGWINDTCCWLLKWLFGVMVVFIWKGWGNGISLAQGEKLLTPFVEHTPHSPTADCTSRECEFGWERKSARAEPVLIIGYNWHKPVQIGWPTRRLKSESNVWRESELYQLGELALDGESSYQSDLGVFLVALFWMATLFGTLGQSVPVCGFNTNNILSGL